MSATRPYRVVFNGKERIVEAVSRKAVILHCAEDMVSEFGAANGKTVMAFVKGGGSIETAGEKPEPMPWPGGSTTSSDPDGSSNQGGDADQASGE
jgi:hypothetical protein